jgi:ribonuclease HI
MPSKWLPRCFRRLWGSVRAGDENVSAPLDDYGPVHTNNRAEVQAAIVALECRDWPQEGFRKTVIATDSDYLVKGATEYYKKWRRNGWINAKGRRVKNQDLWEALLEKLEDLEDQGHRVFFYHIDREFNQDADELAKSAAAGDV